MFSFDYWGYVYVRLRMEARHMTAILSDRDVAEVFAQKHYRVWDMDTHTLFGFHELAEAKRIEAITNQFVENGKALATYTDQLCILVYSYIEATIKDFYIALFNTFPGKMNSYIKDEYAGASNGTGALDVYKRIISASSRDDFVREMARIAAARAMSGSDPKKRLQRIAEVVKTDKDDEMYLFLNSALWELVEYRNELVHEPKLRSSSEVITRKDGDDEIIVGVRETIPAIRLDSNEVLETYHKLYIYLCNLCLANDVPVSGAEPGAGRYLYVTPEQEEEQLAKLFGQDLSPS